MVSFVQFFTSALDSISVCASAPRDAGLHLGPSWEAQLCLLPIAHNPQHLGLLLRGVAFLSDAKFGNCDSGLCHFEIWLQWCALSQGRAELSVAWVGWCRWNNCYMSSNSWVLCPMVIYVSPAPNVDNQYYILDSLCECRSSKEK